MILIVGECIVVHVPYEMISILIFRPRIMYSIAVAQSYDIQHSYYYHLKNNAKIAVLRCVLYNAENARVLYTQIDYFLQTQNQEQYYY